MKANAIGTFIQTKSFREVCVICGNCQEAMFRDCHSQAICSKECLDVYQDMGENDKHDLH